MKLIQIGITLFILTLTNVVHSQNKDWAIGLVGTPNFYSIKSYKGFDHSYKTDIGLAFGVELMHFMNSKSKLGLGVNMTSLGYQVNYNYTFLDPGDPCIPRSGIVKANYVDFPIFFGLNIISNEKILVYSSLGITPSILVYSKDQTTFEDNSIRESNFLNSFILSGQLGLGFAYNFNEKVRIKLEPKFRYYLKGFDTIMNSHPTLFQSIIGLEYILGKRE